MCLCVALRDQGGNMELELLMVGSCHGDAEKQIWVFCKSSECSQPLSHLYSPSYTLLFSIHSSLFLSMEVLVLEPSRNTKSAPIPSYIMCGICIQPVHIYPYTYVTSKL